MVKKGFKFPLLSIDEYETLCVRGCVCVCVCMRVCACNTNAIKTHSRGANNRQQKLNRTEQNKTQQSETTP